MRYDNLVRHIEQQLAALEQEQETLEKQRNSLRTKITSENEDDIMGKLEKIKLAIWESRGKQKAYHEIWEHIASPPIFKVVELDKSSSQTSEPLCPKCAGIMEITTTIDAAAQPGYVTISSHYTCQACGHYDQEQVCLPKEIALQEYNLEQLMKGL